MKDKKSFVELLIVLAVVGIIAAVGVTWLVYGNRAKNDGQISSNDFLVLEDFNVRIPLDDKTSGLILGSVSSGYDNDKSVAIIAPQLDGEWKCESDSTNDSKGTIGTISVTTQANRSGPYEPLATKKVGNYTFGYEQGGSNCTDSPEYQQLVDAFKAQFELIEAD